MMIKIKGNRIPGKMCFGKYTTLKGVNLSGVNKMLLLLYIYLSINLFIYLSSCLFIYLYESIYLSLSIYVTLVFRFLATQDFFSIVSGVKKMLLLLSISLSIHRSIYPFIKLSIYLSVWINLSISVYLYHSCFQFLSNSGFFINILRENNKMEIKINNGKVYQKNSSPHRFLWIFFLLYCLEK